jgi:hypothetical protein
MKAIIFKSFYILIVLALASCEKDQDSSSQDHILGTWISEDNNDILNFVDSANFLKSNINMQSDHYDYQLINDSIMIGYSGRLYIYVVPSMHKYLLNGNNLTIDFRNRHCYGFDSQEINYTRKLD